MFKAYQNLVKKTEKLEILQFITELQRLKHHFMHSLDYV